MKHLAFLALVSLACSVETAPPAPPAPAAELTLPASTGACSLTTCRVPGSDSDRVFFDYHRGHLLIEANGPIRSVALYYGAEPVTGGTSVDAVRRFEGGTLYLEPTEVTEFLYLYRTVAPIAVRVESDGEHVPETFCAALACDVTP